MGSGKKYGHIPPLQRKGDAKKNKIQNTNYGFFSSK
jgi:hypothetical protein